MPKAQSRRAFLQVASITAAASLSLTEKLSAAALPGAEGQSTWSPPIPFQLLTAETIASDMKALDAKPGNNNLVKTKGLAFDVILTTEKGKIAKAFEWHEDHDHIFMVLDGSTVYEVGGTPKGGTTNAPGAWHAPESEGATKMTLKKGDWLTIPRNTPHKRTTEGSVTFYLISPYGRILT